MAFRTTWKNGFSHDLKKWLFVRPDQCGKMVDDFFDLSIKLALVWKVSVVIEWHPLFWGLESTCSVYKGTNTFIPGKAPLVQRTPPGTRMTKNKSSPTPTCRNHGWEELARSSMLLTASSAHSSVLYFPSPSLLTWWGLFFAFLRKSLLTSKPLLRS